MVEILKPFEIADCHSASVAEDIRQKLDAFIEQDLFAFKSGGSVGCLNDQLSLKPVGIVDVDGLFKSGGDKEIANLRQKYQV